MAHAHRRAANQLHDDSTVCVLTSRARGNKTITPIIIDKDEGFDDLLNDLERLFNDKIDGLRVYWSEVAPLAQGYTDLNDQNLGVVLRAMKARECQDILVPQNLSMGAGDVTSDSES